MKSRKIYLASSWRNPIYPFYVEILRRSGHEVYDFRNPESGNHGFHWGEVDSEWESWGLRLYRDNLESPIAQAGFKSDFDAMKWADTFVLALPCGRSAHLEAGWAIGQGKPTAILLHDDQFTPDLMYLLSNAIVCDVDEVLDWLESLEQAII